MVSSRWSKMNAVKSRHWTIFLITAAQLEASQSWHHYQQAEDYNNESSTHTGHKCCWIARQKPAENIIPDERSLQTGSHVTQRSWHGPAVHLSGTANKTVLQSNKYKAPVTVNNMYQMLHKKNWNIHTVHRSSNWTDWEKTISLNHCSEGGHVEHLNIVFNKTTISLFTGMIERVSSTFNAPTCITTHWYHLRSDHFTLVFILYLISEKKCGI